MLRGIWGKKIGMTQVFSGDKVVPVTAIDLNHWYVTGVKTQEKDGYSAIQVGLLRDRYKDKEFDSEWVKPKNLSKYFVNVKEIKVEPEHEFTVGQKIDFSTAIEQGEVVHLFGISKGKGFAGVVKRHGFAGGKASHGARVGRKPGSIGFMRSQGKVIKGTKLPGHFGVEKASMRNLQIIEVKPEDHVVLVKGSVPGGAGSLVFIEKA